MLLASTPIDDYQKMCFTLFYRINFTCLRQKRTIANYIILNTIHMHKIITCVLLEEHVICAWIIILFRNPIKYGTKQLFQKLYLIKSLRKHIKLLSLRVMRWILHSVLCFAVYMLKINSYRFMTFAFQYLTHDGFQRPSVKTTAWTFKVRHSKDASI